MSFLAGYTPIITPLVEGDTLADQGDEVRCVDGRPPVLRRFTSSGAPLALKQ
jgi:hypothetical protein